MFVSEFDCFVLVSKEFYRSPNFLLFQLLSSFWQNNKIFTKFFNNIGKFDNVSFVLMKRAKLKTCLSLKIVLRLTDLRSFRKLDFFSFDSFIYDLKASHSKNWTKCKKEFLGRKWNRPMSNKSDLKLSSQLIILTEILFQILKTRFHLNP